MKYDFLIVGAGLFGATFAYLAQKQGKKCLIIDKREHIGGNVYCENIDGINVHKYGAHIFHTSDEEVWNFVTSLAEFNRYTNSPVALAPDGKYYNLPFNMNTFYELWGTKTPAEAQSKINEQKKEAQARIGNRKPANLEEQALLLVGKDIYELLIKGYTEKQWGRACTELSPEIIRRLPVRLTFDNNYFNDRFQGIPIGGYNVLIEAMLQGIEVRLDCDYFNYIDELSSIAQQIVYTGPIDRFFDFTHGRLQYRTVTFETEILDNPNFQGNAVINYTDRKVPFTRIIEHKHFETFGNAVYENQHTVISREFSTEWNPSLEPYYPVNDSKNEAVYQNYHKLSLQLEKLSDGRPRYIFGGRLAEYKYYDMDKVMRRAFDTFNQLAH